MATLITPEQQTQLTVTGIVFLVISALSVGFRFATKFIVNISIGADDIWILAGFVFYLIEQVLQLLSIPPAVQVPPDVKKYVIYVYTSANFYYVANTCVRIGIICYYRRIFSTPSFHRASMFVIVACVLWCIPGTFLEIFLCNPPAALWDKTVTGTCLLTTVFWTVWISLEILLDAIVLSLPVQQIYSLQLRGKKKLSLAGVFMLGGFAIITNIVRVVTTYQSSTLAALDNNQDVLWYNIHDGVMFLCASLPTYWPLMIKAKNFSQHYWSSVRSRSSKTNRSYELKLESESKGHAHDRRALTREESEV